MQYIRRVNVCMHYNIHYIVSIYLNVHVFEIYACIVPLVLQLIDTNKILNIFMYIYSNRGAH